MDPSSQGAEKSKGLVTYKIKQFSKTTFKPHKKSLLFGQHDKIKSPPLQKKSRQKA
jgi:hypothetical protein